MKHLLIVFAVLFAAKTSAQPILKFDKRFVESEDKWVAFQKNKDEAYHYGFIYVDAQAGLTLQVGGSFTINPQGDFVPNPPPMSGNSSMKVRLQPNQIRVAFIPASKFKDLGIVAVPEWLAVYKGDTTAVAHLFRWGFLYNSWDYPAKARQFLAKAYGIDPKFENLGAELGYTYNALGQFDKAQTVLQASAGSSTDKCYLYKELSYAQMHSSQLAAAAKTAKEGISVCGDKALKSEMAYNIAYQYYRIKDNANFELWAKEIEKWAVEGDVFMVNLAKMRKNEI